MSKEGLFKKRISKEIMNAYTMQNTMLACSNTAEIQGMLKVGMLPNLEIMVDDARKEYPDCHQCEYGHYLIARGSTTKSFHCTRQPCPKLLEFKRKWLGEP